MSIYAQKGLGRKLDNVKLLIHKLKSKKRTLETLVIKKLY